MGYSIAAPCRSVTLRDKMMRLLDREYHKWPVVEGHPERDSYLRGPLIDDLSYHHSKLPHIGYDYNAGDAEREYAFCVVRWIAIRIGRKRKGLPYYVYDGDESITLMVDGTKQGDYSVVDRWGVPIETPDAEKINGIWRTIFMFVMLYEKDMLPVIRAEIQRLDALWEKLP